VTNIDYEEQLQQVLTDESRIKSGQVWDDGVHRIVCGDAADPKSMKVLFGRKKSELFICDPPYNFSVGPKKNSKILWKKKIDEYLDFSRRWITAAIENMGQDASLYIWMGADQKAHFSPLPEFLILMREFDQLESGSFISMRNQRGYGTQKNWMAIRQELLFYKKGNPEFSVQYTDIPRLVKGYYKTVHGKKTKNEERSRSETIRPGNIWVDIQQIFYRMKENVPGAYAQKPVKAITRIIEASSKKGGIISDLFLHSGTSLIACELTGRRCFAMELNPAFAELSIRRLEHFRKTGELGWGKELPFLGLRSER
jgi:site-specific DNA-methyltransferase (adenine-specific)